MTDERGTGGDGPDDFGDLFGDSGGAGHIARDDGEVFATFADELGVAARAAGSGGGASRSMLVRPILSIEAWASDPFYSGDLRDAWPSVRAHVLEICSADVDILGNPTGSTRYSEAILAGAIGGGKTATSAYVAMRALYVLSCYEDPGRALGQEAGEDIVFLFISTDYEKARAKPYGKFAQKIRSTPYFRRYFWPKDFDSTRAADGIPDELHFPGGIVAKPVVTTEKGVISHTVACAVMDEAEHMNVVAGSSRTRGVGAVYDQAEAVAGELLNRMDSRMMKAGRRLGMVLFTSSPKYPKSFLQSRISSAKSYGWRHVYVSELSLWESQRGVYDEATGEPNFPDENTESGGFSVEIGDDTFLSRILKPGDKPRENARILRVPVNLRPRFDPEQGANLDEGIRDFGGIPMLSVSPLIEDRAGLAKCVRRAPATHAPDCACDDCMLAKHPFPREESYLEGDEEILVDYLCTYDDKSGSRWPRKNREAPRFVHIDGAFDTDGGDAMGLVMLHPYGTRIDRGTDHAGRDVYVTTVLLHVDLILRIRRDPSSTQLEWSRVRDLLLHLRDDLHFDIVMVSMDKYQSRYFLQEIEGDGFDVDHRMSVDDKPLPYLMLRDALAARRVSMYEHKWLIKELHEIEFDRRARRCDHPKHGCFVGDTRIPLLDGTHPMLSELNGRDAWVYSATQDGKIVPGRARGRLTKYVDELVDVVLDTGAVERCTPEHPWMLRDGTYKAARDLRPGIDRLMSINRIWPVNGGYEKVTDKDGVDRLTHRLVCEAVRGEPIGPGIHVHHANGNKTDNRPENVEAVVHAEHTRHHTKERHRSDPAYRRRVAEGLQRFNLSDEGRRKHAAAARRMMAGLTAEQKKSRARKNSAFRHDVDRAAIESLRFDDAATNANTAARILGCGRNVVIRVLRDHGFASWEAFRAAEPGCNHKVRAIIPVKLAHPVPVYDLEVDHWSNFALCSGVFVHNSKDCADALAGAAYKASTMYADYGIPSVDSPEVAEKLRARAEEKANGAGAGADREGERGEGRPPPGAIGLADASLDLVLAGLPMFTAAEPSTFASGVDGSGGAAFSPLPSFRE